MHRNRNTDYDQYSYDDQLLKYLNDEILTDYDKESQWEDDLSMVENLLEYYL